jgi:hypothetical protein
MNINPLLNVQLPLFVYGESTENYAEVLPVVWNAVECLVSPEPITRQLGIDSILELGVQKSSPLVAYMIAMRLGDTDINIRRRVIYIVADIISWEPGVRQVPDIVRKPVTYFLHDMGDEIVFGLLEVSVMEPQADKPISQILNSCPLGGKFLGNVLNEWKNPLAIREKAIYFIGEVGYMEMLPILERLLDRLEARQNGQYSMSFAPSSSRADEEIIRDLRIAINRMSAH